MLKKAIKNVFHFSRNSEALLLIATIAGLIVANSIYHTQYHQFFTKKISLQSMGIDFDGKFSIKLIIDDFLMAIFFLLIGLELKREVLVGELSSKDRLLLPVIGGIGGVIVPALIFAYFNYQKEANLAGFAIPTATDIAFAYAVVKAFGQKISSATKVFLISLAVVDDLIAISIIAFFYTANLNAIYLLYSFIVIFALFLISTKKSSNLYIYMGLGLLLWTLVFKSGIHPSIAGVVLAMFIPFKTKDRFLLEDLAKKLSPYIGFFILPLFAFANSGVRIINLTPDILLDNLVLGTALGLFIGKQLGVFSFVFLAFKMKICSLPKGSSLIEFYGVSIITGIGFTMSLFIGNLAFDNNMMLDKTKIAVLIGSLASFIYGSIVLILMKKKSIFDV